MGIGAWGGVSSAIWAISRLNPPNPERNGGPRASRNPDRHRHACTKALTGSLGGSSLAYGAAQGFVSGMVTRVRRWSGSRERHRRAWTKALTHSFAGPSLVYQGAQESVRGIVTG